MRLRKWRILPLLFLFCCPAPVAAQEAGPVHKVRILTSPPSAELYLDVSGRRRYEKFLGRSDEPILLDLSSLEGASGFNIIIKKDGYFDKRERIATGYFATRERYPEEGRIRLEPENWTVPLFDFLSRHQGWFAGGLLTGALLLSAAWSRRGRLRQRMAVLERISSRAGGKDPYLNTVLGRWRLDLLLGRGGSATVYRAIPDDTLDEREAVAVKLFTDESARTADFEERFRREAKIYQSLSHPGIARLIDWGRQDSLFYLVLELVEGKALDPKGVSGPEEEKQVLQILLQVASALAHAHDAGVIHRDVKPDNILLTPSGKVKLLDFGLAREVMSSFTKTGQLLGTPLYMAPEQIRGSFVDHRCDQYGLGVTAYELFTGRKTFASEDGTASPVLFQQLHNDPPPMREVGAAVSPDVERLVRRLMCREPAGRFANTAEVIQALKSLLG